MEKIVASPGNPSDFQIICYFKALGLNSDRQRLIGQHIYHVPVRPQMRAEVIQVALYSADIRTEKRRQDKDTILAVLACFQYVTPTNSNPKPIHPCSEQGMTDKPE